MYIVYKIKQGVVQLANYFLLHAYSRTAAAPRCTRTTKLHIP